MCTEISTLDEAKFTVLGIYLFFFYYFFDILELKVFTEIVSDILFYHYYIFRIFSDL